MRLTANSLKNRFVRTAAAIVAGTAVTTSVLAPPASAAPDPLAPPITWEECPEQVDLPNAECGRVEVPREYSDPTGPTISVGFVRAKATNPSAKRGSLFINPGGPGGDAYVAAANSAATWPEEMRAEWDIIGVQPRGLPGSTPLECTEYSSEDPIDQVDSRLNQGPLLQRACDYSKPGLFRSLHTSNTAEDWEMVRRSLGLEQISILGISYGTYLGSVYATRYPQRVDKLVLDSAVNPWMTWSELAYDQREPYRAALNEFFAYVAMNDNLYHMGTTPLQAYTVWRNKILAETGTTPTAFPPPAQIGDLPPGFEWTGEAGAAAITAVGPGAAQAEGVVRNGTTAEAPQGFSPTYNLTSLLIGAPSQWHDLALHISGQQEMEGAQELDPRYILENTPEDELKEIQGRQANAGAMQQAVMCNEDTSATNPLLIPEYLWNLFVTSDARALFPLMYGSGAACGSLAPVRGVEHVDGSQLATRPLQISGTRDAQTPYDQHRPLADAMGAHVLTVHGPGHGHVGSGNQVVDQIVVDYLRTGNTGPTDAPGYFESLNH